LGNEITENFLQAIEYPKLLTKLASHCQTPAGRDYLKALEPLVDATLIENRLSKTRELEKHLLKVGDPTIPDSQFFIDAFEKARSKGEAFSAGELASLAQFLSAVVRLRQYLTPEGETPGVFQEWLGRLHALPELRETLKSIVSDKGELLDSASPELKSARDQIKALRTEVQDFYQSFLQKEASTEALQEKIVTAAKAAKGEETEEEE